MLRDEFPISGAVISACRRCQGSLGRRGLAASAAGLFSGAATLLIVPSTCRMELHMGVPVSHGIVLAFFDHLNRHQSEVLDLTGLSRAEYDSLVSEFVSFVRGLQSEDLEVLRSEAMYRAIAQKGSFTGATYALRGRSSSISISDDFEKY